MGHLHCREGGHCPYCRYLSLNTPVLTTGLIVLKLSLCSRYLSCVCTDVFNCWSYLVSRSTTLMLTTELIVLEQLTE